MVPPSVVLLFGGIWVVSRRYGGWRHILGIAAIVLGVLLAIVTVVGLFGIGVTTRTASAGLGRAAVGSITGRVCDTSLAPELVISVRAKGSDHWRRSGPRGEW